MYHDPINDEMRAALQERLEKMYPDIIAQLADPLCLVIEGKKVGRIVHATVSFFIAQQTLVSEFKYEGGLWRNISDWKDHFPTL